MRKRREKKNYTRSYLLACKKKQRSLGPGVVAETGPLHVAWIDTWHGLNIYVTSFSRGLILNAWNQIVLWTVRKVGYITKLSTLGPRCARAVSIISAVVVRWLSHGVPSLLVHGRWVGTAAPRHACWVPCLLCALFTLRLQTPLKLRTLGLCIVLLVGTGCRDDRSPYMNVSRVSCVNHA